MTTATLLAEARRWRRHLHRHPELGFAEHDTAEFLAANLTALGLPVTRGVGGTGVVASLTRGAGGRAIGLRADMDALALTESGEHEHRSIRDDAMHACGHDGHMAMLLGAAHALAADHASGALPWSGTVHFVFQPAEEHGEGARAMLGDGLIERFGIEAMYGLHNIPGIPAGHLHTRTGPIMAAEDNFRITVRGRGGHASRPQDVVDPIVVSAEILLALQTIVARTVDPLAAAVVSATDIVTDGTRNAIPSTVTITGDTRSFTGEIGRMLGVRIGQIARGISAAHGASCEVEYTNSFQPTVNDPGATRAVTAAATAAVGADRVDAACAPIMASEDFAAYGEAVPACFALLGTGRSGEPGVVPLHSRDYDFNDEVLGAGIDFYRVLVRQLLGAEGTGAGEAARR